MASAKTPEEICSLFQKGMSEGDLESVLQLYDAEAVFVNRSGERKKGQAALQEELAPLAGAKARFDFDVRLVVRSGEIARRQADGAWRWLIGDPFTVGRHTGS